MLGRIAATVARGRPEDGGRDAETSRGDIGGAHGDAPNRDMTHKAPTSPVRSTDMVFTRSKNLHAMPSQHPGATRAAQAAERPRSTDH